MKRTMEERERAHHASEDASTPAPVAILFATGRGQLAAHTVTDEDRRRAGFTGSYARKAAGSIGGAFMQVLEDVHVLTVGQVVEAMEAGVSRAVSRVVDLAHQQGKSHEYRQVPEAVGKCLQQNWTDALCGSKVALILMVGQYAHVRSLYGTALPFPSLYGIPGIGIESLLLKSALESKGFQTTLVPQADVQDVRGTRAALAAFARRASACDTSIIIASGHGVQLLQEQYEGEQAFDGVRLCAGDFKCGCGLEQTLTFNEIRMAATARKANIVLYGACREDATPFM